MDPSGPAAGHSGSWAGYQVYSFGAIFGLVHDDHEWRQKLTVEVKTPGGPRRGSAVVQVNARFFHGSMGNEVTYQTKGEATVVEVAPGQYLFALIGGADERFYAAARDRFDGMDRGEWLFEIPKQTEPVALTGGTIPLLVTFTDINDPTTVTRVDPGDLAASFGPGVRLTAMTLEVTDDTATEGRVEAVLGWLPRIWPNHLDGERYETIEAPNRFANSLTANSFSKEIKQ